MCPEDTEKGIKVLLYCKVLQRGGADVKYAPPRDADVKFYPLAQIKSRRRRQVSGLRDIYTVYIYVDDCVCVLFDLT